MKTKFFNALSLALIMAMLVTSLALADNVVNDVTIGGTDTFTAPGSTTINYKVNANGGDGQSGCNASDGSPATVMLSVPAGVTASTTSLTFTACNAFQSVTFSSSTPGNYAINVSSISDSGAGSYNNQANFTLHVQAPPPPSNTAPSVVVAGVTDGASYAEGSVPAATCQVTDAEDGNSSFAATLSAITGPYASDGIGSQTANCSYTDTGSLTATASATYSIVDPSAPSISYVLNPASPDGTNDWYKGGVTLTWTVSEPESPNSLSKTGCVDQNITADQAETTYSCSATSAGGSTGPMSVSIKRDGTAPTISGSASPAPNSVGWNNSDVTVSFTCNDNLSGVASCPPNQTVSSEAAGQSVSGIAVDNAGNSAGATVSGINIDKTAPSVSLVGGPADGGSYYFGSVPAAPTCSASDALSGLAGACSVSGYGTTVGSHTVTASASDNAGNSASASATYTVLAWTLNGFYAPVDMSGVYNLVKGGSTVPLKFEVFAGPTELTVTSVVKSFVQTKIACDGSSPMDEIEVVTTGGTSLRYDATAGQFIQNWQTPRLPGACYRVTMTTQDGSFLQAFFKLK